MTPPKQQRTPEVVKTRSNSREGDNREVMVNDDITLFEAWFEVMAKNEEQKDRVNVEELVDKVASSGLFTFNNNCSNLLRKMEEKTVKEELLDLIEEDLGLNVVGFITINQFFKVIVRFPRYLHRLKRAAGDVSTPPRVWDKPAPKSPLDDDVDDMMSDPSLDPFDTDSPKEESGTFLQLRRMTWRKSFKDLFQKSSEEEKEKPETSEQAVIKLLRQMSFCSTSIHGQNQFCESVQCKGGGRRCRIVSTFCWKDTWNILTCIDY
jgi:hypothetical protein